MANAKKCDITGEFYDDNNNRDYTIKYKDKVLDIGPTIYNELLELLQPTSEDSEVVEGKLSLMDIDDINKEETKAIMVDINEFDKKEKMNFVIEEPTVKEDIPIKEESPPKEKNKKQSDYHKNLCKVANEIKKDYPGLTWHQLRSKAYQKINEEKVKEEEKIKKYIEEKIKEDKAKEEKIKEKKIKEEKIKEEKIKADSKESKEDKDKEYIKFEEPTPKIKKLPVIKEERIGYGKIKRCDYCGTNISPNMLFCKDCTKELSNGKRK